MFPSLTSHRILCLFIGIVILCGHAHARTITRDLVSDGGEGNKWENLFLRLPTESSCEQTYGFLPCTTTVIGNLFLIVVYGFLMYKAATFLSNGSELLLEILGPGIVGGLFLPILGALPDAMLILVSGLSGSKETAQSQVSVGMGLLAGSTVLLLTIIWGTCVIVGKCDIEDSIAIDSRDTRGFSLTGSGVSTDIWTSYAARIMAISVLPFVIVQFPQILNSNSGRHLAVLIALIVSLCLLVAYCLYQIFQPWIQRRKLEYIKHKHVILGLLRHLKKRALGRLLREDGEPDEDVIRKWLHKARSSRVASGDAGPHTMKFLSDFHTETKREHDLLDVGDQSNEDAEGIENAKWTSIKAVLLLLLGTIIAAAFADPLVDAVDNFSDATSIPAFFISFIALPLATNSSEAVSAIIFASRDKRQTASLTFSEIYGAVTMNNVLCLSVFLALVYVRGLTWNFSSEVLVILVVCIVVGVFASFRTVFPLWTSILAILLYPFSLVLVYVLDFVFGWS
ncbi:sodium/calcium exchanger NCL1 isoform X2 [Abrus precatorius]|uniref:Sodium/calcium exchanger NCL1 isoform X2 n=1 Tax=Abrus precatorius TaxID=3816 RepID=A0A8B8KJJ5_ABRPR|nr:sodium/calcium exchanger NCL1 isoform X2 [Abrus precatorius]